MEAALAAEFGAERLNLIFPWLDGGGCGFEFNYSACHIILWWFVFADSVQQPGAICLPAPCGFIRRPTWVP
jgi:hypothetical protein